MIIGSFEYDAKQDAYLGDIVTLNFTIERVTFKPNTRKGDKDPDYRVIAPTVVGHVELGAAWNRTSDKGREFISVSLDAPLLDAPLNAALFLNEDGTHAALVWNRRKDDDKTAATTNKASGPAKKAVAPAKKAA